MRPLFPRAGATLLGALSLSVATAAPAAAQVPAPVPAQAAAVAKADATLTVTRRTLNVRAGRTAAVSGRLAPAGGGRVVRLERRTRGRWRVLDRDLTSSTGRFALAYRTRGVSSAPVRVRFTGDATATSARRTVGRLNVFRPALASWYGPGLFGNPLGCGGRLYTGTAGVAHKSLPCGTRVTLRKGSRIVRVRVIDRGPYVGAREFDLTQATKRALGFGSTGTIEVAH